MDHQHISYNQQPWRNQETAQLSQRNVSYPEVVNLPDRGVENQINRKIKTTALSAIPDSYFKGQNFIQATSSYDTSVNQNDILSLTFENYTYWEGAPHGITIMRAITVNLETGQRYQFWQLFDPRTNWKAQINAIIRAQIAERQIPMLRPFEGVTDKEEYFLTNKSLVIFYQIYDYTPYVYGILEFEIPYNQIENIINPEGPIGKILE